MEGLLNKYFNYLRYELNRASGTVLAYETDIRQFCEWLSPSNPEEVDFLSVTSNDVRSWLAHLARKGIIPRSLRRKIISLRSLFIWLMKTGQIKVSPLRDVPLPKIPKPLPELIKPREIEGAIKKLEEASEEDGNVVSQDLLIIEILYTLGLRRAEVASINDEDISFSKGEIKVTGKRSKQRVIPVPEVLLKKIRDWQILRDESNILPESHRPLFVIKGKRISHHQIYEIVKKALGEATAKKKSPHALRHSFASGMLNGGAEIDSVREFLGHASLATTQIYTHISLREIKKAYGNAHPRSGNNINHQDNK